MTSNELNNEDPPISPLVFKKLRQILFTIVGVTLAVHGFHKITYVPKITEQPHYDWEGYNPSKPITDMSEVDFVNHTIKYSEPFRENYNPYIKKYSDIHGGLKIQINGIWVNLDNVDHHALFQDLNLEYEDLYEYLMD